MKLSILLFGFLAAAVHCIALPPVNTTLIPADELPSNRNLFKREEEWTLVLYNEHKKGGQCGGQSETKTGDSDQCLDITNKKCVDIKVNPNVGIASCSFGFKAESCSGPRKNYEVVQGGSSHDKNGVDLNDEVKFVSVTCSLGG
ncbi:hypothetical protein B0T16DRAFT_488960 [Cercophora newfieldiana]|uniref:Secreted protein n=1 Tax=Cercophora newfieldiana TaxID=92897 RepID=A0AA39YTI9_9PEZI|nr:hypothetical protein B0T16DRAFT_488960 [Cercophora newfieldiana]